MKQSNDSRKQLRYYQQNLIFMQIEDYLKEKNKIIKMQLKIIQNQFS